MKTVVGLFDNMNDAQSVVQDLVDAKFDSKNISLVANNSSGQTGNTGTSDGGGEGVVRSTDGSGGAVAESAGTGAKAGAFAGGALGLLVGLGALAIPGIGPVLAAGPLASGLAAAVGSTALGAGLGAATGGLLGGLVGLGVPEQEAGYYSEGVRRGGALVTVSADDSRVNEAVSILNRNGAVDIDQRGEYYQQSGYTGFSPNAEPFSATQINSYREQNPSVYSGAKNMPAANTMATSAATTSATNRDEVAIPIVEEQLTVGKREVQRGGVRIYTRMEERPVEEQVTLREEHVNVERRPVNREVSASDLNTFKEGTIEVTSRGEEAVVAKTARVVEEVVIDKEAVERTETVRDTVRRTEVDVEELNNDDTSVTSTTASTTTTGTTKTGGNTTTNY